MDYIKYNNEYFKVEQLIFIYNGCILCVLNWDQSHYRNLRKINILKKKNVPHITVIYNNNSWNSTTTHNNVHAANILNNQRNMLFDFGRYCGLNLSKIIVILNIQILLQILCRSNTRKISTFMPSELLLIFDASVCSNSSKDIPSCKTTSAAL